MDKKEEIRLESDQLLEWLQRNGGQAESIAIRQFDHGGEKVRGVGASSSIRRGQELLRVPRSLFLAPGKKAGLEQQEVTLAAEIAKQFQLGSDGQYERYLQALPGREELDGLHPFYASNEDLVLFSDIPYVSAIRKKRTVLRDAWLKHKNGDSASSSFDWEGDFDWPEFLHAFILQLSRRMRIVLPAEKGGTSEETIALVPIIDMINFCGSKEAANVELKLVDDGDALVVVSKRSINEGEELLLYAAAAEQKKKENGALVYQYGVMMGDNDVPSQQLEKDVCESLESAIHEIHGRKDQKHKIRMLFSALVYECCQDTHSVRDPSILSAKPIRTSGS
ncbi:hypothetical protein GUITHDRAFT_136380 [Guillardia theta CCMP2712]|uniref:SET domain-containing protein n=2 Tax=Guillardia theta TaxID=55529 RepID=L1JJH6_GUITC|nr:hypothetical protein GUITHDRAFT_136380 [Guillardia theta CCMP2712]EKX48683.1 hypothetical protein GUITHDRAFT_136380 [Guillardia theta CCMP2712]|eukprot:XP_005835663.1 hypothetical protein GUITHDRAFT_136380 [Guillardia theta CCMP2712]